MLGVYNAGSQSVSFPEISGVDTPTTCVKAASYNCSGILKKLQKFSHSIVLTVLALSEPDLFACSTFLWSNFVTALNIPSLNPVGQKYFTSLVIVMQASLGFDSLLLYWDFWSLFHGFWSLFCHGLLSKSFLPF